MITLIENSIRPATNKGPKAKTIFDSGDRSAAKYFDISKLSGNRVETTFIYTQDDEPRNGYARIDVPAGLDELETKAFIIEAINAGLGE